MWKLILLQHIFNEAVPGIQKPFVKDFIKENLLKNFFIPPLSSSINSKSSYLATQKIMKPTTVTSTSAFLVFWTKYTRFDALYISFYTKIGLEKTKTTEITTIKTSFTCMCLENCGKRLSWHDSSFFSCRNWIHIGKVLINIYLFHFLTIKEEICLFFIFEGEAKVKNK